MSSLALPGPDGPENDDDSNPQDQAQTSKRARRRRSPRRGQPKNNARNIPSAEACLAALAQLPGLVALKYLTPAEANAVRGVYQAILQHHQKARAASIQPGIADADLLEIARANPEILSMLEPLLTDEQMDLILGDNAVSADDA